MTEVPVKAEPVHQKALITLIYNVLYYRDVILLLSNTLLLCGYLEYKIFVVALLIFVPGSFCQ